MARMTHKPDSSHIEAVHWNDQRLAVKFKGTEQEYVWHHVPRGVFESFQKAPSAGKFFHRFVQGKFPREGNG